jgi:hypothetical protein
LRVKSEPRRSIGTGVLVTVAIVALIVVGSMVYWLADGRVGTPDDFRQRVSDAGLNVDWSNSGPRGGSGSVDTSCGPVDVGIDEIDGELWIRWLGNREVVTPDTIDALRSCSR